MVRSIPRWTKGCTLGGMGARRIKASNALLGGVTTAARGLALALTLAGTGCSDGLAARLAEPPDRPPVGATRCQVTASQLRPLIVEWEAADRASLEVRLRKQGLVAVRYEGCELEVLRCQASGQYHYSGVTVKQDGLAIETEDDLYGSMPIGAVRLAAKLRRAGRLNVETSIVGMLEADHTEIQRSELAGACAGATHVIAGAQIGAFRFFAGGEGELGGTVAAGPAGAGLRSAASKELLGLDGNIDSCHAASRADAAPPEQCGALLRLEMVELVGEPTPPPPRACPRRMAWDGMNCVPARLRCPWGSRRVDGACVDKAHLGRGRAAADTELCTTGLDEAPTVGRSGSVRAHLPRGVLAIREALRFYDADQMRALAAAPCRSYAMFESFVDSPARTPAQLREHVVQLALFLADQTVQWSELSVDADGVHGAYEYNGWMPDGNERRKGWATIKLDAGHAYFYVQETDAKHWDALAGTFRASAATLRVGPLSASDRRSSTPG
jgi:hypothetical protein